MLYDFSNLSGYLTELGYPPATTGGFQIIKRDLTQEEQSGNLEYRTDGIYLNVNGEEYKGYMYLKFKVKIGEYGLPKFHITNCSKIRDERAKLNFQGRYFWHNNNVVSIEDRPSGIIRENQTLELCNYCKHESNITEYHNTAGFYSLLDKQETIAPNQHIELDIYHRPLDWDKISKEYRIEKNYTCESCTFGGDMLEIPADKRFIHVDHKIAWELWNMRRNNLQCLCILCHSQKDDVHRANFAKPVILQELQRFIEKYKTQLKKIGNPYI